MMMTRFHSKIVFFLLISVIAGFLSCSKERYADVPYVPVNITINESLLAPVSVGTAIAIVQDKNNNATLVYADGTTFVLPNNLVYGNGVFLYRYSVDQFIAFDRTCTHKPQEDYCATEILPDWGNVSECPCCESRFLLNNGGAFSGPAAFPLKMYHVSTQPGLLIIQN